MNPIYKPKIDHSGLKLFALKFDQLITPKSRHNSLSYYRFLGQHSLINMSSPFARAKEFYKKLENSRGSPNILGGWSSRWLGLQPDSIAEEIADATNRHNDFMLVRGKDYVEINIGEKYVYSIVPAGGVGVESNYRKWESKVDALLEYSKKYCIEFVVLSIGVQSNSHSEQEAFEKIKEKVSEASLNTPNIEWILYQLKEVPFYDNDRNTYLDVGAADSVGEFATGAEGYLFKEGQIADSFGVQHQCE